MKDRNYWKIFTPFIIAVSLVAGMIYAQWINSGSDRIAVVTGYQTGKINTLLTYIEQEYVDTISMNQLVENSIPKILENLDPHSVYIPASEFKSVNEPLEGNFDGIGVQFNIQKDTVFVIKVVPNGPSEKAGILDGDRIIKVNDTLIAGVKITSEQIMKKLRGLKGTRVKVSIFRPGLQNLSDFIITRDKIPLHSVDVAYMADYHTGVIKLNKFSRTTYQEFIDAVKQLRRTGMDGIIIDLRGNGGGYLDAAVNIVDEFIPAGKLIVYTQGKSRPKTELFSTSKFLCGDLPVIIMIDEWSASASEIMAGAIQDNDRGLIMGRRSFGKGLVQEAINFNDGSALRLTTSRYYTPSGRCIQKTYSGGSDNYNADIQNRLLNGEFTEKDSIHFSDSQKYFTQNGRIVYGGGGIMPDIFIPADTTGNSTWFSQISRTGLEYQFAFEYTDKNRKYISQYKTAAGIDQYLENQDIFKQFIGFAEKNGIRATKTAIHESGFLVRTRVKALIARNILDNDGFFPIIQNIDVTLLKAIELMKDKEKINEFLTKKNKS